MVPPENEQYFFKNNKLEKSEGNCGTLNLKENFNSRPNQNLRHFSVKVWNTDERMEQGFIDY